MEGRTFSGAAGLIHGWRAYLLQSSILRTPGHTPGNSTYVWKASQSGNAYTVVLPGSLSSSARTIPLLKSLPCDVYLGAHGKFFDLREKYARLQKGGANPYIDPNGYHAHIKLMEQSLYYKLDAAQRQPLR